MKADADARVAQAVAGLPQILQPNASRWFEDLEAAGSTLDFSAGQMASLARLVACSEFAARTAQRERQQLGEFWAALQDGPGLEELEEFAARIAVSDEAPAAVKSELRRYRHRFMLQLLWRELEGLATVADTLAGLSALADQLLNGAAGYAARQLQERFGHVRDADGKPVGIVILGMGKLGGGELNFSSDIDLIFLYPHGGDSDGERSLSAAEYFTRLSRQVVALLDEVTADGFAFRIDTRLRPFGDSGPPVVNFTALESYLSQHGRDWERYAYVKARIVGPQPAAAVAAELLDELITPFVYRRYVDFGVFESLREMHALIAAEVKRRELADNVKLGPGGIREIEFIVQSLQLVRGGHRSELRAQRLQRVLPRLVGRSGLTEEAAAALSAAYDFLRRVENFVQAMRDQQTHELPGDATDQARLCVALGYPDWASLREDLDRHRRNVSEQFEAIAFRRKENADNDEASRQLAKLWETGADAGAWTTLLQALEFPAAEEIATALTTFAAEATQRIDTVSRQRLREFMPALLLQLRENERPLLALQRTLLVVEKILRRSAYLALLNENELALQRLVNLCGKSAYIAEQIARLPILLDELLDARIYTTRVTRAGLEEELEARIAATDVADSEAQMEELARFQRASQFRVAVADYNDILPIMRVSDCLTDLAETVLAYALRVAWNDLVSKHGAPSYRLGEQVYRAGFGIVAYGKFGGIELSYGSDLDLVFLHDSQGGRQQTDGARALDNTMFFTRLVRRLVHFLTTQTGSGMLYEIDMRLRPDGRSGVMVSSIEAFERYQEQNAWTWEHQALLRARPVAGSARVAREFERVRAATLTARVRQEALRDDVVSMRQRMRRQLDKSDGQQMDLKQGQGGIGDIEFLVQYLVLSNAALHPAVIHYTDNIRQLATLAASDCIDAVDAARLQQIYRSYRERSHHLALDGRPPLVPAEEFAAERGVVGALWQRYLDAGDA